MNNVLLNIMFSVNWNSIYTYNQASFNYKPFRFEYDMHAVNVRNII